MRIPSFYETSKTLAALCIGSAMFLIAERGIADENGPLPPSINALKDNVTHVVSPQDYKVISAGKWAILANDKNSPSGQAVKLSGKYYQWALQYSFPKSLQGTWNLYLEARCDSLKDFSGDALNCGIFNKTVKKVTNQLSLAGAKLQGSKYQLLFLGQAKTTDNSLFYAAASGKAGSIAPDVWVGRLILSKKRVPEKNGMLNLDTKTVVLPNVGASKARIVDDQAALSGKAISQPCSKPCWSVQWHIPADSFTADDNKYVVRIRVKSGPLKKQTGEVFYLGIYNAKTKHNFIKKYKVSELSQKKYTWLEVPEIKAPTDKIIIFVSPVKGSAAEYIYIDRVEIIPKSEYQKLKK